MKESQVIYKGKLKLGGSFEFGSGPWKKIVAQELLSQKEIQISDLLGQKEADLLREKLSSTVKGDLIKDVRW